MQDPDEEDINDDTEAMLAPGEVRSGADAEPGGAAPDQGLKPADIDAYWLQRNISKAFGNLDENEAVKKAEEVFNALQVCMAGISGCAAPFIRVTESSGFTPVRPVCKGGFCISCHHALRACAG